MKYEIYEHHGTKVSVREDLKGKHAGHCLCHSCAVANLYCSDPEDKCPIADKVFNLCKDENLVLPVWECPKFVKE